ncbi:MAG: tRNA pseudouridine(55) synthase TruB [Candidatus Binatia bacterium]|nr:tRNA pseudouridine(55) synthase TruB [Candidatus Binatia bacterium]
MPDGILLIDKPSGCTSADVVRAVKRRHRPSSVGHLGTLDPMATGLLPLCIDGGTRIAQFLGAEHKAYTGRIRLGLETDTLDVTGKTVAEAEVPEFTAERVAEVAETFLGDSEQIPPMYSAVKKGGKRLYELARQGVEVEREARPIHLERFRVEPCETPGELDFEVRCSKGTYVRVLASDLGKALGTLGSLASLRRTEFGCFQIEESAELDSVLEREPGDLPVLAPREALRGCREFAVDGKTAFAIAAGQRYVLDRLEKPAAEEALGAVIAPNGGLLAVLESQEGTWRLRRVVMPEASELYRA